MTSKTIFKHGYALLIGVDQHSIQQWALPDVGKDIGALHNILVDPERCAYPSEQVKVLTGEQATKNDILEGLEWLNEQISADKDKNTTAIIYYSGHGWHDNDPDGPTYYLIPYDTKRRGNNPMTTTALGATDFAQEIEAIKPQRLLVVLDCCHAAGIDAKDLGSYTPTAIPLELILSKGTGSKGIEELQLGQGRAILSSSQGNEQSYIRADETMSIFTYHLIEALTGHAQPQGGAKEVLVTDALSYVHRHVPTSAKAQGRIQHPSFKLTGNFPIAMLLGGKGLAKGESPPDPTESSIHTKQPTTSTVFNQSGQTVYGGQANIGGNLNTGGGMFNTGSIDLIGSEIVGRDKVIQGDEVRGNKISGDYVGRDRIDGHKITMGNISDSKVTIGSESQGHTESGLSTDEIAAALAPLYHATFSVPEEQRNLAIEQVKALQLVIANPQENDEKIADIVKTFMTQLPAIREAVRTTFQGELLAKHLGRVTKWQLKQL